MTCCIRFALPRRPRLAKAATGRAQGALEKIIVDTEVQFSESFEVDGPKLFEHACKVGLEGVVSKVRDSAIRRGASMDRPLAIGARGRARSAWQKSLWVKSGNPPASELRPRRLRMWTFHNRSFRELSSQ